MVHVYPVMGVIWLFIIAQAQVKDTFYRARGRSQMGHQYALRVVHLSMSEDRVNPMKVGLPDLEGAQDVDAISSYFQLDKVILGWIISWTEIHFKSTYRHPERV